MLFHVTEKPKGGEQVLHVVEAPSFFDAKKYMSARLGIAMGSVDLYEVVEAHPNIELRWEGSDAGAYPNKRLMVRERPIKRDCSLGEWSAWSLA